MSTFHPTYGIVAAAASEQGEPLRTVKLFPMGEIVARDGRRWKLEGRAHAEQVVAASLAAANGTELMFDYDHQVLFGAKDGVGGTAPASGWIKRLFATDDGIFADVEWTEPAAAKLRAKEYRYVSPLFTHEKPTGRITRLVNAALVNIPAITELPAVASALGGSNPQGTSMDLTKLLALLGLQAGASIEEIVAACEKLKTDAVAAAMAPLAKALGLDDTATGEQIAAAAATIGSPDPSKFVPIEQVTALNQRITSLEQGTAAAAASSAVDAAMQAGKLTPALKDWGTKYATQDLAGFQSWVDSAPQVVTPAAARLPGQPAPDAEPRLTSELQAAAAALGLTDEEILATAKEQN